MDWITEYSAAVSLTLTMFVLFLLTSEDKLHYSFSNNETSTYSVTSPVSNLCAEDGFQLQARPFKF